MALVQLCVFCIDCMLCLLRLYLLVSIQIALLMVTNSVITLLDEVKCHVDLFRLVFWLSFYDKNISLHLILKFY